MLDAVFLEFVINSVFWRKMKRPVVVNSLILGAALVGGLAEQQDFNEAVVSPVSRLRKPTSERKLLIQACDENYYENCDSSADCAGTM